MAVRAKVAVGDNPLASTFVRGLLWVPNIDSSTVSVVDPATNAVTKTIPVGPSPIAVAGAGSSAWVTSELDGDLWRFDPGA
jgi:YVTN family beta-propeller protein